MNLQDYLYTIIKEVYHQGIAKLTVPSYEFSYKDTIKINDVHTYFQMNGGYDSDENIPVDEIVPQKTIFLNDVLYTPDIKKIIGRDMTTRETKIWEIDGNPIKVKDLVEVVTRLKPKRYIFGNRQVCPIRHINTQTYPNKIEICLYY